MARARALLARGLTAAHVFVATQSSLLARPQEPLFELTTYPVPVVADVMDVDVADVNGDGHLDIGVLGGARYHVFFGAGDGSFLPPEDSFGPGFTATLADVTGDGLADRLLVDMQGSAVEVHESQGDGQFTSLGQYGPGCFPMEAIVADLNGDVLPDLAIAFGDQFTCQAGFTTYLGDGLGGFGSKFTKLTQVQAEMIGLSAADLDRDGDLDLVATSSGSSLCRFLGAGDGTFGPMLPFPGQARTVDTRDVDADGLVDVLGMLGTELQVYRGTGQGTFAPVIVSPGGPATFSYTEPHLALADLNGDGHLDAAGVTGDLVGHLRIALGLGSGVFEPSVAHYPELNVDSVRAADVDGDGSADLVMTGGDDHDQVFVLLNSRPAWPWETIAPGLPAAGLEAPKLSPAGSLEVGDPVSLSLDGGASGAPAVLIVGVAQLNAPFKGGVLVPMPTLLLPLALSAGGGFDLSAPLTTSLPSGAKLYLQAWIVDAAGPVGFTSSNAVVGTAP